MNELEYDIVNFTSYPSPERSLDRFWFVANLFNFPAILPSSARILEIGCSTGRHLLSLAERFSSANFEGIDLSKEQISKAISLRDKAEIHNIDFVSTSFDQFRGYSQGYDYIICHGLYSWIDKETQGRLLKFIYDNMADSGVVYISHNCLPGYRSRQAVIELLKLTDDISLSSLNRINNARQVIQYATDNLVDAYKYHGLQLKDELERNLKRSDQFILHELLNFNTSASTLSQMINECRECNLNYIGDAHPQRMPLIKNINDVIPRNIDLKYEKKVCFFDILHPASFRGSLFAKNNLRFQEETNLKAFQSSFISSPLVAEEDFVVKEHLESFSMVPFYGPSEEIYEAKAPALKLMLAILADYWPQSISYKEIMGLVKKEISISIEEETKLQEALLELFAKNLLDVYSMELSVANKSKSSQPIVSKLTRVLANEDWLTTLRGERFDTDPLDRIILPLLDGSRNIDDIIDQCVIAVKDGRLILKSDGQQISSNNADLFDIISEAVQQKFSSYYEHALLTDN